jgi:hypothetical protein
LVDTLVPGVRRVMVSVGKEVVKEDPESPELTWFNVQQSLAQQGSISGEAMHDYLKRFRKTKEYSEKCICAELRSLAILRAKQAEDDVTAVVPKCDAFVERVLFHVMLSMSWDDISAQAGPTSPPSALVPVVKKAVSHTLAVLTKPRPVNPASSPDISEADEPDDPNKSDSDSDSDKSEKSEESKESKESKESDSDSDSPKDAEDAEESEKTENPRVIVPMDF